MTYDIADPVPGGSPRSGTDAAVNAGHETEVPGPPRSGWHGSGSAAPPAGLAALVDDPRITAMGLLAEAVIGLGAKQSAQFADHGIAAAEFEVLVRLSRSSGGALRMSDLAAQTSLTTSGITRLVDRLERSGLLRRRACPSDRRGLLAELTDAGWERLADVLPGHLELIDRWLIQLLDPTELDNLLTALRKIRDAVQPCATAGSDGR